MAQSIEPNITELANGWMKSYNIDYKLEQKIFNADSKNKHSKESGK